MSLAQWMKRITEKEMPAFQRTASEVMEASNNPKFGSDALGQVILKDPALTARVLRVANAVAYNPSGRRILTVSKAIMVLGVDTIRNICLGLTLMESLLRGRRATRVMADLGRSIHAAILAKHLTQAQREPASEEVFIAALLYHVGNMVFWCFSEDEGVALDALLKPGMDESVAAKAVLGFGMQQLSHALVEEWKLSNLLVEIFKGRTEGVAAESVIMAWRWSLAVEQGWDGKKAQKAIAELAAWLRIDPASTVAILVRAGNEARETATLFGSNTVAEMIPLPPDPEALKPAPSSVLAEPSSVVVPPNEEDPSSQLGCLKRLAALSSQGGTIEDALKTLVQGIHAGLGMDRTVLCLVGPDDQVVGRLSGEGTPADFVPSFRFTLRRQMADSLSRTIEQGGVLVNSLEPGTRAATLPEPLGGLIRGTPFLFGTVQIGGKTIGAVYADRGVSGGEVSGSCGDGFRHLLHQANITLGHLAASKAG